MGGSCKTGLGLELAILLKPIPSKSSSKATGMGRPWWTYSSAYKRVIGNRL
jgi:hypothetical protein